MKVLISRLKAKLSHYLNAVREGEIVTVFDRRTPIARIVPLEQDDRLHIEAAPASPRAVAGVKGVRAKRPVDILDILAASRGDR